MGWMICILLKVEHKKWVGGFVFYWKWNTKNGMEDLYFVERVCFILWHSNLTKTYNSFMLGRMDILDMDMEYIY